MTPLDRRKVIAGLIALCSSVKPGLLRISLGRIATKPRLAKETARSKVQLPTYEWLEG
jgi:hypothetical protein